MKNARGESRAWSNYWSQTPAASSRCLPDLPEAVSAQVEKIWEDFFYRLPAGSRLLDLGTGSGVLLRLARAHRPDLRLTGIDSAETLPEPGCGITLLAGTKIEALPFANAVIEVITSQFAIEYANLAAAVKEVGRVLSGDGSYLFLCHHAGGVVVRDNLDRLKPLRGLLSHAGLIDTAINSVRQRKKSAPETRQRLFRICESIARKYPGQSIVAEVSSDLARIMAEPDALPKLFGLRHQLEMEGERLKALSQAALTEAQADELAARLPAGKNPCRRKVLHVPETSLPFAWIISNQPGCD